MMGDHVHVRLVRDLALVSSGTLVLALGDTLLYEAFDARREFNIYTVIKPGFLSPSVLLIQLATFFAVGGCLLVTGWAVEAALRRWVRLPGFLSAAPVAVAALALLVVALRFVKNSEDRIELALLIGLAAAVAAGASIAAQRLTASRRPTGLVRPLAVVVAAPVLAAFLLPELIPLPVGLLAGVAPADPAAPNIVVLVLDTVRADHLSCTGSGTVSTPNIDRLAADGMLFRNAYASGPWTVPSHASMFTGLQTGEHGADWGHTLLEAERVTMAEVLAAQGYLTAGFSENPFIGHGTGMAQGFATFFEAWRRPVLPRLISRVASRAGVWNERMEYANRTIGMFRHVVQRAEAGDQPFFAFVNLMAAHLPRYPRGRSYDAAILDRIQPVNLVPERHYLPRYALDESELAAMRSIYEEEIEYLDRMVGKLERALGNAGALDQTILVVTSDHGEHFGEHGFIEHQLCLYQPLIHVPLILRYPPRIEPRVVEDNVSTVALLSTIADLIDLPWDTADSIHDSVPLHLVEEDQLIVAEFANGAGMLRTVLEPETSSFDYAPYDRSLSCVIVGSRKLITDSRGVRELYDLSGDPLETEDLSAREPELVELLSAAYVSPLLAGNADAVGGVAGVDQETMDALRELGYVR